MILFDWKCPKHGVFESSHPICPTFGCESEGVIKVFLKAPGYKSDATKRFDAGIRKSAESMNLTNFRSAKAGEAAHGGDIGRQVLWGKDVEKIGGKPFSALAAQAAAGANVQLPDGRTEYVPDGMRQAAPAVHRPGQNHVPKAERTVAKQDVEAKAA